MADVFRAPISTRVGKIKNPQVFDAPNLLLSTLAVVVAAAPFTPKADAQPVRKLHVQQVDQQANRLLNLLTPNTRPPFASVNFDNARPLRRVQTDSYQVSRLLSPAISKQSTDRNPRKVGAVQDTNPPNLLITTLALAPVVTRPFSMPELPQPRARRTPQVDVYTLIRTENTRPPFYPVDLPQPRAIRRSVDQTVPISLLLRAVVVPAAPFSNFTIDMPRPLRRVQFDAQSVSPLLSSQIARSSTEQPVRRSRLVQVDQPTLLRTEFTGPPFVPVDGPQPSARRTKQDQQNVNLLLSTLIPSVGPAPFFPVDMSQPRARRVPQVTGTDNPLSGPLWYVAPDPLPIGQADFPQWRRHREAPDQYLLNTLLTTLAPTVAQDPFPPVQLPQIKPRRLFQSEYAMGIPFPLTNPLSPFPIDGQSSVHLTTPYGTITVYNDGLGNYFSIARY